MFPIICRALFEQIAPAISRLDPIRDRVRQRHFDNLARERGGSAANRRSCGSRGCLGWGGEKRARPILRIRLPLRACGASGDPAGTKTPPVLITDREKEAGMSETSRAWFHMAQAYLCDAVVLEATADKPPGGFYGEPVRFLYFHSIELFLKTYLRLQGVEEDKIRKCYGHNLAKIVKEAECQGLSIVELVRAVCEYAAGGFDNPMNTRYVETGWVSQIPAHKLREASLELHSKVSGALRANGISVLPLPALPTIVDPPPGLTMEEAAERLSWL